MKNLADGFIKVHLNANSIVIFKHNYKNIWRVFKTYLIHLKCKLFLMLLTLYNFPGSPSQIKASFTAKAEL